MAIEQQLMIRINAIDKEASQSINILANEISEMETNLELKKKQIEQMKGLRAGFVQVNNYYNELMAQPDEIRKFEGMK